MTSEHKAALAEGRAQGRIVRQYLEALEANKPKRGRKRSPAVMERRLREIPDELATADPLKRVQLIQERMDLQSALATSNQRVDLTSLEEDFVKAAKGYSARKGITYAAWRELGVPAATLKKAGIARGG